MTDAPEAAPPSDLVTAPLTAYVRGASSLESEPPAPHAKSAKKHAATPARQSTLTTKNKFLFSMTANI
jgi:hypothetical protein